MNRNVPLWRRHCEKKKLSFPKLFVCIRKFIESEKTLKIEKDYEERVYLTKHQQQLIDNF